jgi:hypothetical protein
MKTIALCIAIAFINNCKGQESQNQKDKQLEKYTQMERPKITPESEKINLDDYKDKLIITKGVGHTNPYIGVKFEIYNYDKIDSIGKYSLHGDPKELLRFSFIPKNSVYEIIKVYYPNKNIKVKCILVNKLNIFLGKEYNYNDEGKLTKTIDHDLGWDFSFENVVSFVKTRKGDLQRVNRNDKIEKSESKTGLKYWTVKLYNTQITTKGLFDLIKLDAKTGQILSHIEYEIVGGDEGYDNVQTKVIVADKTAPKIFTTHKDTEEEWRKYEEELYQKDKKRKK